MFGFSIGAQIALRSSAQYPAIHALVADGPIPATAADLFPPTSVAEWPRAGLDWIDNWFVDRFLERDIPAPIPVVQALAERPAQPLLLIATGQTGHGRELRQAEWFYSIARAPKQIWELPDIGHGEGLAKYPREYAAHVVSFFNAALLEKAAAQLRCKNGLGPGTARVVYRGIELIEPELLPDAGLEQRIVDTRLKVFQGGSEPCNVANRRAFEIAEPLQREILQHEQRGVD